MEVISVILMFVFGNMNDQATQMTQYIPMKSLMEPVTIAYIFFGALWVAGAITYL
jgi:hypothetical protein